MSNPGPESCDVAVVGGGPAGSLAATFLARAGHRVVLLERQAHPRPNVGESLIPDFWKYCDAAGVTPMIEAEGFVRKAGGTVRWRGGARRMSFGDFGYDRPALHVERDRFDKILLDHARSQGVEVRERTSADRFEAQGADGWAAVSWSSEAGERGRLACRHVVDASGQRILIARQLGLCTVDPAFRFVAVWGYFTGSQYVGADGELHAAAEIEQAPPTTFVEQLPLGGGWGWSWHIQMRRSASVGLLAPVEAYRQARRRGGRIEDWFAAACASQPVLGRLLADATLIPGSVSVMKDYSYRVSPLAGPGWFLVGDAAGFIDPIFSVGIVLAMHSARTAAWAIDRSLRNPAGAARYRELFDTQLQARLELSRRLAAPQYGAPETDGDVEEHARLLRLFGVRSQALMSAATELTGRASNLEAIVRDEAVREFSLARLQEVGGLED